MPDVYSKDAVALVDIGYKSTSICLLQKGELIVSRVVNIGGDKLTQGLAEAMSISYAEAEGLSSNRHARRKVQIRTLEPLLMPLGRELRASIDFFEHQQDRTISAVYISGSSARFRLHPENIADRTHGCPASHGARLQMCKWGSPGTGH